MTSTKIHMENSLVIVSAEKTGHICTGTTLSMLKIHPRSLIHILKVKIQDLKFLTLQHFCLPNDLS